MTKKNRREKNRNSNRRGPIAWGKDEAGEPIEFLQRRGSPKDPIPIVGDTRFPKS